MPAVSILVPGIPAVAVKRERKEIAVIDATPEIYAELDARLSEYKMKDGSRRYIL